MANIFRLFDPATVYILDQYSEERTADSLALPGSEYRSIGLSDCFEASLEIQISSFLSIMPDKFDITLFVLSQKLAKLQSQINRTNSEIYCKHKVSLC